MCVCFFVHCIFSNTLLSQYVFITKQIKTNCSPKSILTQKLLNIHWPLSTLTSLFFLFQRHLMIWRNKVCASRMMREQKSGKTTAFFCWLKLNGAISCNTNWILIDGFSKSQRITWNANWTECRKKRFERHKGMTSIAKEREREVGREQFEMHFNFGWLSFKRNRKLITVWHSDFLLVSTW